MRIPRLLTILGPAAVLYVLAARASASTDSSPSWLVGVAALCFSFTPLFVAGARQTRRTAEVAFLGVCLGLATASARTGSPALDWTHGAAWLLAAATMLDLAIPRGTRPWVRTAAVLGFSTAALSAGALEQAGLLPSQAFGVVVVGGVLAIGALHQVVLVGRGYAIEGALSGMAIVAISVGLAYAWLGPFEGLLATTVESTVAGLLFLGHLAWVDLRWRSLRRIGVPVLGASVLCFLVAAAFAGTLAAWQLGVLGVAVGVLWSLGFSVMRRVASRSIWTTSGRLADATERARENLVGATTIDRIAVGVLSPFVGSEDPSADAPELFAFNPPLRMRLDPGQRANVRSGEPPSVVARTLLDGPPSTVLDLVSLEPRVVREPALRDLVDSMRRRSTGVALPCRELDHIEGVLLLPLGARSEPLSKLELHELGRLSHALGGALSSALAQRRAESHIHQLSELRRAAEAEIDSLKSEVSALRDQNEVLGRGLSEDQTLHVAYSPTMRSVQTRAIELASSDEPISLVAASGSPVLPVCRFIHDRGPRWRSPFVVADCAAVPPDEAMGLLFGSDDGRAGWFRSAAHGTLLLKDVSALSRELQARLARALQQETATKGENGPRGSAPRVIVTLRSPMEGLRGSGALDPALERCFPGPSLSIPSLRDRREDIPSLTLLALDRACRVLGRDPVGIDQRAMTALVDHDWPGDVAELELVLELAVDRVTGTTVQRSDLPPFVWSDDSRGDSLDGTHHEVEKRMLERALLRAGGNKSEAARRLGLKRTTFLDKLRRVGLDDRTTDEVGGSAVG